MELLRKPTGPITPEFSFDIFCSFLLKKDLFLEKRSTDCNPNSFWILTVQDRPKTSPANAYCPSGIIDFSNIVYIDNLLVENSKKICIFDNKRVKLAKNGQRVPVFDVRFQIPFFYMAGSWVNCLFSLRCEDVVEASPQ